MMTTTAVLTDFRVIKTALFGSLFAWLLQRHLSARSPRPIQQRLRSKQLCSRHCQAY